jgi:hypothetical protein
LIRRGNSRFPVRLGGYGFHKLVEQALGRARQAAIGFFLNPMGNTPAQQVRAERFRRSPIEAAPGIVCAIRAMGAFASRSSSASTAGSAGFMEEGLGSFRVAGFAIRYTRWPSAISDVKFSLSFLRTVPAKKPRTECCCQLPLPS